MNKYIIKSFVECSLYFKKIEAAQEFADEHQLGVCKVYYLDEHTPTFLGYAIENENGLLNGNEFTWV